MKVFRNTRITRALTLALCACLLAATLLTGASAATWRTGNVPSNSKNTSAITVTLSNTSKDAYVKIHAYAPSYVNPLTNEAVNVKERNCTLSVTMRDQNGKWIWENSIDTGSYGKKMRLGNDHSVYKLYLRHQYSVHCWDTGHHCPIYWGVECVSNCSVK